MLDLALALKIPAANVHAVSVELDPLQGEWWDYARHRFSGNSDERYLAFAPTPLAESDGKIKVVRDLSVNARTLMVGDGFEKDVQAANSVGIFAVWFNQRSNDTRKGDLHVTVHSMQELLAFFMSLDRNE